MQYCVKFFSEAAKEAVRHDDTLIIQILRNIWCQIMSYALMFLF